MKITLCGSTRFKAEYEDANFKLTLAGHIVYSCACMTHADGIELTDQQKEHLDLVHLKKILESDAIVVVGEIDGVPYLGASTSREVEWAKLLAKEIYPASQIDMLTNEFDRPFYLGFPES